MGPLDSCRKIRMAYSHVAVSASFLALSGQSTWGGITGESTAIYHLCVRGHVCIARGNLAWGILPAYLDGWLFDWFCLAVIKINFNRDA